MSFGSILYVGLSCFLIAVLLPKLSLAFLWLGASLVFVAFAYKDSNAQRLGKRRDGSFSLLSNILLFPYLFLIRVAWIQYRYTKGKVPFHPLVDNIWIGRRLLKDELPEGPAMMIDLSYEFSVDTKAYDGKVYRCLPILDCHTPDNYEEFSTLVDEAISYQGDVYITSGQGRGRVGLFAAFLLLRKGVVATPEEAFRWAEKKRSVVVMAEAQVDYLKGRFEGRDVPAER